MKRNIRCRKIGYLFLGAAMACLLAGCSSDHKSEAEDEAPRVAAILSGNDMNRATDFWDEVWGGVRDGAQAEGIALSEYTLDTLNSTVERVKLASAAKVDGMILAVSDGEDQELLALLKEVRDAGIKIVVADTDIGETYYDAFVGIDNDAAGEQLAAYLCEHWESGEKILVLDVNASEAVAQRKNSFLTYLEQRGMEEAIEQLLLNDETEVRVLEIQHALEAMDGVKWVVSFDPSCTLQSAEALDRMGISPDISLIGFGESDTVQEYLENQVIQALFEQDNYDMGYLAVEKMEELLNGSQIGEKQSYVETVLRTGQE